MIINGLSLLDQEPLAPMLTDKVRSHGVSFGLSEAGYDIRIKQSVYLHPFKRFALASTIEKWRMPYGLVAVIHDKSTWARRKLSVFNTVVEPGWCGFLTLELVYHGWGVLHIPAGVGIAQALFHEIANPTAYKGKYQNQPDCPVKPIFDSAVWGDHA